MSSNDSVKSSETVPETPMKMDTGKRVSAARSADKVNVSSYFSSGGAEGRLK